MAVNLTEMAQKMAQAARAGVAIERKRLQKFSLRNAKPADLDLQNHRHNQRTLLRLLGNVALQVATNFFFDHAVVGFLFLT